MNKFVLLAQPWWVNLLIIVPVISFLLFRKGVALRKKQLLIAAVFGIAFGFVEAATVAYLRSATNAFPGYTGSLSKTLFVTEFFRELATIVMLVSISMLSAHKLKERFALFLWIFAFWDLVYYVGLRLILRWPNSLTMPDVLFLVPVPWLAQVWFPCLISGLTILAIAINRIDEAG